MDKPKCKVTGEDGNIFAVMGRAAQAMKDAGQKDKVPEMRKRVLQSHGYDAALAVLLEYVEDE
jgi:hypothetical protein